MLKYYIFLIFCYFSFFIGLLNLIHMNRCDRCETNNFDRAKYCSGCGYELPKKVVIEEKPVEPPKGVGGRNKVLLGGLVGILVFFVIGYTVQNYFLKKPLLNITMVNMASEMNKSCPIMIDSETRLDNTIVLPGNIFQYNYTLINLGKESIDTLDAKRMLEPNMINLARTNPDMKYVRDNDVKLSYYYKDKNGDYLFKIIISPEQYK